MNDRWYASLCSWNLGIFFFNQIETVVWIVVWLAFRFFFLAKIKCRICSHLTI